jgi:hypothetical protein
MTGLLQMFDVSGGGDRGQGRRDRVTMSNGSLSTVEVDGAPLTEAATHVLSLWEA